MHLRRVLVKGPLTPRFLARSFARLLAGRARGQELRWWIINWVTCRVLVTSVASARYTYSTVRYK